jgi:hypothetical protein
MKITIKNIIKENKDIDPKQRFVNEISKIIKPPYFYFLRVNEVPEKLWNEILSKLFNQKVKYENRYPYPFRIFDSNNNEIYIEESYEDDNDEIEHIELGLPVEASWYGSWYGFWSKREYDENNNRIYQLDSTGFWIKREYDSRRNVIYYEDSDGVIRDNRPSNPINENTDPKQRYVNGILNMIRRPYMEFLINNEVPEELWEDILSKIFNTDDIDWGIRSGDDEVYYQLIIQDEKGKQLYYETHDYWEQLIYGYHTRLDMDFTWYINSVGSKKVTFVGKHNPVVYSNGPTGYPWSGLSNDIKNNKFFDLNY